MGTMKALCTTPNLIGNMTFLVWNSHIRASDLACMELVYDRYVTVLYYTTDMLWQSPEWSETISNASEKMLESNGHFLHAKIIIEQQAIEIVRLQEACDAQKKGKSKSDHPGQDTQVCVAILSLFQGVCTTYCWVCSQWYHRSLCEQLSSGQSCHQLCTYNYQSRWSAEQANSPEAWGLPWHCSMGKEGLQAHCH